jgi:hypothetical protein
MSLVQASKDPKVYAYVMQNLGKVIRDKGDRTACGATSKSLLGKLARAFAPPPPPHVPAPRPAPSPQRFFPVLGGWKDYTTLAKTVRPSWWFQQKQPPAPMMSLPPEMGWEVPEPREPTAADLLPREPAKLKELIDGPVRELMLRAPVETILEKLQSKQPLMRWLAIQVISRKRLHVEREVIETLRDPNPVVRQAAREALVRLARGTDFGPPRNATPTQVAQSIEAWQGWLVIQDTPTASPSTRPAREGIADPPAKKKKR